MLNLETTSRPSRHRLHGPFLLRRRLGALALIVAAAFLVLAPSTISAQAMEDLPAVEPANNQDELPEYYRLNDEEIDFLKYTVPIARKNLQLPRPVPPKYLSDVENPLMKLPNGDVLVVGDLLGYMFSLGRIPDPTYFINDPAMLNKALTDASRYNTVQAEAKELGLDKDLSYQAMVRSARQRAMRRPMENVAYARYGDPITQGDVRMEYERTKHEKYRTKLQFKAYHIFLMGYERVESTASDRTLLDIARRVSGDGEAVREIRVDDSSRARRWTPEPERGDVPWTPLQPGEKLLVPMDLGGMEKLAARAQELVQRLEEGEDFLALAHEYSDAEIVDEPIYSGEFADMLLPEIRLAINETPVGEVTPVIETKHGFQVFKVLEKRKEEYKPFEEVAPDLALMMLNKAKGVAVEQLYQDLLTTPMLSIDKELIYDTADQTYLDMDTVMAKFGDRELRFRDVFPGLIQRDSFRTASPEKRIELLERSVVLSDALYTQFADEIGLSEMPGIFHRVDFFERYALSRFHMRKKVEERHLESTPLLYDFFTRHYDFFKRQPIFSLSMMLEEVDPNDAEMVEATRKKLEELKESIDSAERFQEIVKTTTKFEDFKENGGFVTGIAAFQLGDEVAPLLDDAQPDEIIGPFGPLLDDTMGLIYVISRDSEWTPEFEDAFELVTVKFEEYVKEQIENAFHNRLIEELEGEVEFLYPEMDDPVWGGELEPAPTPAASPQTGAQSPADSASPESNASEPESSQTP